MSFWIVRMGTQGHLQAVRLLVRATLPIREQKLPFVDLNRDELLKTPLLATYTGTNHLWLPRIILESDFVVSMAKVKAHHWSGVTPVLCLALVLTSFIWGASNLKSSQISSLSPS